MESQAPLTTRVEVPVAVCFTFAVVAEHKRRRQKSHLQPKLAAGTITKCLRSLVGVSGTDRVRNEELRKRAGIERELASRADQRVLRWFGHVERMDEYRMAQKGVDGRSQWGTSTRETEVTLDGWCEGGLRQ